jgi:ADP-L-glycero-D-manno-heptose 6-epimerase
MDRLNAAGFDKPYTTLEDGIEKYVSGFLNTDDPYR